MSALSFGRGARRGELAWHLDEDDPLAKADQRESVRIPDLLLFLTIPFATVSPPLMSGVPLNEVAAVLAVLLALARNPQPSTRFPLWPMIALVGLLGVLSLSMIYNDLDATRRLGHVGVWAAMVWALGSGRLSVRSAAIGLGIGLVTVTVLASVGIGGRTYGDRLTGFFGDPNVAAFYLLSLGPLVLAVLERGWAWRLAALVLPIGLLLTYSRTGLIGLAFAILWLTVGRRMGVWGGGLLAGALVWLVDNIPDSVRLFGPFSAREGSDLLRERILAQEQVMLDLAPWYGNGPGTSRVAISDTQSLFFHNSYLATLNEGGWVALGCVLALLIGTFLRLQQVKGTHAAAAAWCEVALLGTAVLSVTLGEVLLDLPTAIALGVSLWVWRCYAAEADPADADSTPAPSGPLPPRT